MRAGERFTAAAGLATLGLTAALLAGCGGEQPPPTALPTFPPTAAASTASAVPLDPCVALISPADVANVLGLDPLKVMVRTIVGVPAPAVGRTERLDCSYTGDKGVDLFDLRSATYSSDDAAREQWQLNLGTEDGDKRPVPLGSTSATLVTRKGEALLSIVAGPRTLAVQLPDKTVPKDRSRDNLIVDFAQRVLHIDPSATPSATPPPAPPAGPPPAGSPPAGPPVRQGAPPPEAQPGPPG